MSLIKPIQRRQVLQAMLAIPAVLVLPRVLQAAAPAEMLPEADPMANALKYKADASQADANFRKDKTATCFNCSKYNKCAAGDATCKPVDKKAAATAAPCELFAKKHVSAKGWCMSWAKA